MKCKECKHISNIKMAQAKFYDSGFSAKLILISESYKIKVVQEIISQDEHWSYTYGDLKILFGMEVITTDKVKTFLIAGE